MKLPCIDCICLAICKNTDSGNQNIGVFLTGLANHCSSINAYLNLHDHPVRAMDVDYALPMSKRWHVTQPLSERIIIICSYMEWDYFDLERFHLLANRILPEGET